MSQSHIRLIYMSSEKSHWAYVERNSGAGFITEDFTSDHPVWLQVPEWVVQRIAAAQQAVQWVTDDPWVNMTPDDEHTLRYRAMIQFALWISGLPRWKQWLARRGWIRNSPLDT